ncbi:uncharacterized protein LOC119573506 [Penaeus monodon]|uniref:uncharacterized protein LOC119573506 n=1 Tax=Penaeus monodon TaxID=6687 RepID=UPI0018A7C6AC|nr:uncharacterized protein LOC119573506 [Penaeus monodon]
MAYVTAITNLRWENVTIRDSPVLCDISTGRLHPFVPTTFRRDIFDLIHGLGHPSICSTTKLVAEKFVALHEERFQRLGKELQAVQAQQDSSPHQATYPRPAPAHMTFWSYPCGRCRTSPTVTDHFTHWPKATSMEDAITSSCLAPGLLVLANGLIKRWHQSLKTALTARCTTATWTLQLPWVLHGLRTAPMEDLTHSAAEMVYGQLLMPREYFPSNGSSNTRQFAPSRPTHRSHRLSYTSPRLDVADFIFLCDDATASRYPSLTKLQLDRRIDCVIMEYLKPTYMSALDHDDATYVRPGRHSLPHRIFNL